MNPWKVILATVVIFGAGVVTGGLLVHHAQIDRPHRQRVSNGRVNQPLSPGGTRLEFLRRAQRELDLTPEQRERVDQLIADSQERIRKVWEPVTPKVRETLHQTREQFRGILTPKQQALFDDLCKQQQHFREQRRPQPAEGSRPTETGTTNAGSKGL